VQSTDAVTIDAAGSVTINCTSAIVNATDTTVTGTLEVDGLTTLNGGCVVGPNGVQSDGDVIAGTVSLQTHIHGLSGGGTTLVPV
jgi:phage baseplate assembly protein gpV